MCLKLLTVVRRTYIVFLLVVWVDLSHFCLCHPLQICKILEQRRKIACGQPNGVFHSIKRTISDGNKTFNLGCINLMLYSINLNTGVGILLPTSQMWPLLVFVWPVTKNGFYIFKWLNK